MNDKCCNDKEEKDLKRKIDSIPEEDKNNLIDSMTSDKNLNDTTRYGEFISSFHNWTSLEKQKKRVEQLEDMTSEEKDKREE